ncbi:MAG: carbon-nitrogen hydrolase [bacterium]|nr:carbon-nitrogen hydrolase [bacterium]
MSAHTHPVTIALVQMQSCAQPRLNMERATDHIRQAAAQGAQIVCLQELFHSPYFCQSEDTAPFRLAEPIPGPSSEKLSKLAAKLNIVLIAPIFEQRTQGLYHNSAVIFDADGAQLGVYRKMHIPDDPGYYEKYYFTPGDRGYLSFTTRYAKIGVLICWDQWFPEAARLTTLGGAQIIFYPSAIGWHDDEPDDGAQAQYNAWETVQRSHAITNGVFVAVVNRVGQEGEVRFWGASFVANPYGQVIARAPHDEATTLLATCDLSAIDNMRQNWPFLRDRRIDTYAPLTARFRDDTC